MKTAAWAIVALLLWWLVATIGCGAAACVPYILFFYFPFWFPIVVYIVGLPPKAELQSAC
jgi:hypothetical protein